MGSVAKAKYCVAVAIEEMVKRGNPIMVTHTFRENLTDKEEAERRWRNLRQRIQRRYPNLKGVHVWQLQQRGAWHLHGVWSNFVDVNWLRAAAVECGFGPQIMLRTVSKARGGFESWDVRKVVNYVTRYFTRDFSSEIPRSSKLIGYIAGARVCTQKFSWVNGLSRVYRRGVEAWHDMGLSEMVGPLHEQGFWFIVRLGFDSLDPIEQEMLLLKDSAVRRWFYAIDDPF